MNSPTIEFINHASVIISYNNISILSDPWYKGSAFHNGWRLIYELEDEFVYKTLKKITHIFISHEHPDHFVPSFFLNPEIKKIILDKDIEILFQNTFDKRIFNFFKKNGFNIKEIDSKEKYKIRDDLEVQIIKHDFYDTSLIIRTPNLQILNLNDCPLRSEREIRNFKKKYGSFDILLTQFSYAAWKGGINNKNYREKAAKEKMNSVSNQAKILNCKSVIPFASFVYFSNELNYYMNDSINTPKDIKNSLDLNNDKFIFLSPGEIQDLTKLKQKESSMKFWEYEYLKINSKKKDKFNSTKRIEDLLEQFLIYKDKIFRKNSKIIIFFLKKIKFLNFFQPIKIKLTDHNKIYLYNIFEGLTKIENSKDFDIQMHSESLFFIFKNEFGFDTLTVNGCFETNNKGFAKVSKSLAIGNLNALGLGLNFKLIFNLKFVFLFSSKLRKVLNQII